MVLTAMLLMSVLYSYLNYIWGYVLDHANNMLSCEIDVMDILLAVVEMVMSDKALHLLQLPTPPTNNNNNNNNNP